MAIQNYYIHTNHNQQEVRNFTTENVTAKPTGTYNGQEVYDTTTNRRAYYDLANTQWQEYATVSDITSLGELVGGHDASTGVPTTGSGLATAIDKGDFWYVTTPGTITGLTGGSEVLEVGDILISLVANPTGPADFLAWQANLDLPTNITQFETVTIPTLAANTPLDAFALTTFTTYNDLEVYDAAGQRIELCISNAGMIESNVALTNLTARVFGSN